MAERNNPNRPADPGGAPGDKGKATRVGRDGFVEEEYPGYDPADYLPDLPGKPQEGHVGPRRDFDQDRDRG